MSDNIKTLLTESYRAMGKAKPKRNLKATNDPTHDRAGHTRPDRHGRGDAQGKQICET